MTISISMTIEIVPRRLRQPKRKNPKARPSGPGRHAPPTPTPALPRLGLRNRRLQLLMHVMPLAQTDEGKGNSPCTICEACCRRDASSDDGTPATNADRKENRSSHRENFRMGLIGGIGLIHRAMPRILHRERGGDDEHISLDVSPSRAARIIRPMRGSTGNRASCRPTSVRRFCSSTAPISCSVRYPSRICRESGGSMNGKFSISPSPNAFICKITLARFVRRISGSVNCGRERKSSSE